MVPAQVKPAVSPQMAIEISMEHHQSFDDRPFQADDVPMQVRLAQEYLRTVSRLSTSFLAKTVDYVHQSTGTTCFLEHLRLARYTIVTFSFHPNTFVLLHSPS